MGRDRYFNEPRLGGSHDHGHFCLRGFRQDVLRYRENQAVDQIRRQIKVFALDLLLTILSGGADRDLAAGNVDRDVSAIDDLQELDLAETRNGRRSPAIS